MTIVRPFADFLSALREKDAGLYAKLCHLRPHEFWPEWKKTYPKDFPLGGMSPASASSVMPRKAALSERLANWDQRRAAFRRP